MAEDWHIVGKLIEAGRLNGPVPKQLEQALRIEKEIIIITELGNDLLHLLHDYLREDDADLLKQIKALEIVVGAYNSLHNLLPDEGLKYSCITWGPTCKETA